MVDSGFEKVRIVLQHWNRHLQPSRMKLDGRVPDLFLVSSMGMHGEKAMAMIRDASRIDQPPQNPRPANNAVKILLAFAARRDNIPIGSGARSPGSAPMSDD